MNKPQLTVVYKPSVTDRRIAAECRLIRATIFGPEEVWQSCGWLKPEQFHDETYGEFWRRFLAGDDIWETQAELGLLKESMAWGDEYTSPDYAASYARQVARGAYLDAVNPLAAKLGSAVVGGDFEKVRELTEKIALMTPQTERKTHTAFDTGEAFLALLDQPDRTIQTFITPLDSATGGLERQTLSVLAARPSMGKSSLAFQVARNVAANGYRVLFVSLEMAETNLWARAACGVAGLTWLDAKRKRYSAEQRKRLEEACFDLMNAYGDRLLIHDCRATTDTVWDLTATERPALVIVDHLRLLADSDADNENKRLGLITWRLKQMAKTLDCHVMALAQLNRQPDARGADDRRPTLTDLRDSGEIEENADLVLMLYRDGYYKPGQDDVQSPTEVWIRKARDGVRDVQINLIYDTRQQWFSWR